MRVSARAEYAIRVMVELAAVTDGRHLTTEQISAAQAIAAPTLVDVLRDLRRVGLVRSRRGREGGYLLARPADELTIADVMTAISGPLLQVGHGDLDQLPYYGPTASLADLWLALKTCATDVLGATTLADVSTNSLPAAVQQLASRSSDRD